MNAALPFAVLVTLAACSSAGAPTEPSSRGPATSFRPAIGKLQLRDRTVTMFAAKEGMRVTLEDTAGHLLAEDISLDDLHDRDPFAYEACHSALGRTEGSVDATLHMPSGEAAGER
jgi:hypothetical protein